MLKSGNLLWGTWCHIPHPEAARVVALLPHDFCFIDGEHTPIGPTELASMVRSIQYYSQGSMVPLVRCPTADSVRHALNAGAGGIVMPHIQTRDQAEELVRLVRFPPRGDRSVPPHALLGPQREQPALQRSMDIWDDHVALFCQIEDVIGVQNVEQIAQVDGVDGLMVGGYDLQASLNLPVVKESMRHRTFLEALTTIQGAADAHGLAVLGSGALEVLEDRVKMGWRAFLCSPDTTGILVHGNQELEACKAKAVSACTGHKNGLLH